MNAIAHALFAQPDHVQSRRDPAVLATIRDADINLAVWGRQLLPGLAAEAQALLAQDGCILFDADVATLNDVIGHAFAEADWAPVPLLAADIAKLATQFASIMQESRVSIRLEIITGDACKKFHADYVTARLISSYAGPGTQWLSNADAADLAAGVPVERLDVRAVFAGEVALFKGRRWTDAPIIHRSPPIAGTGQRRLVLVINSAEPKGLDA